MTFDVVATEAELRAWLNHQRSVALCSECGGDGVVDGLVIGTAIYDERCHACKGTGVTS